MFFILQYFWLTLFWLPMLFCDDFWCFFNGWISSERPCSRVTKAYIYAKQECIPVGCIPPAHWLYLIASAMHTPCHAHPSPRMHTMPCMAPCHACSPATHTPCHICPPATHAPLQCTSPLWTEFLTNASENITLPQLRCGR